MTEATPEQVVEFMTGAMMSEPCVICGYPREEHSYNGACYGLCGKFEAQAMTGEPTEAMMPGPCVICGLSNYPLSAGGPTICPSCDCGDFGPVKIERQRKEIEAFRGKLAEQCGQTLVARAEVERLQSLADDMGQTNIMNQIEIEQLQAESGISDGLLADAKAEIAQLRHHHDEFVVAANIRMVDQNTEIEQLQADKINLAEENLRLLQLIDGYARATLEPK